MRMRRAIVVAARSFYGWASWYTPPMGVGPPMSGRVPPLAKAPSASFVFARGGVRSRVGRILLQRQIISAPERHATDNA